MRAKIGEESERGVGIRVRDNNGGSHGIVAGYDGEIKSHSSGDYHDRAAQRSKEENEHGNQAERYGRFFIYENNRINTFPWDENLPRIEAAREAIDSLSIDEFETYFGEFHQAVAGSVSGQDDATLSEFMSALDRDISAYAIDVFLDDNDQVTATSAVHAIVVGPTGEPVLRIGDTETDITTPTTREGKKPDARIELVPTPIPQLEPFQRLVVHQTTCQIRDYHIVMGEQPPEEYRVLGFGKYKFAVKYRNEELPMYEDYTRFDADIPGYRLGFDIEDYPEIETGVKEYLSLLTS